jgi:hypothetical protein
MQMFLFIAPRSSFHFFHNYLLMFDVSKQHLYGSTTWNYKITLLFLSASQKWPMPGLPRLMCLYVIFHCRRMESDKNQNHFLTLGSVVSIPTSINNQTKYFPRAYSDIKIIDETIFFSFYFISPAITSLISPSFMIYFLQNTHLISQWNSCK